MTVNGEPVGSEPGSNCPPMATLMRHPNQILNRDQLISLTFNREFQGYDRAIDNQIARIRKRISRDGIHPIQTVYGAGYKFVVNDE